MPERYDLRFITKSDSHSDDNLGTDMRDEFSVVDVVTGLPFHDRLPENGLFHGSETGFQLHWEDFVFARAPAQSDQQLSGIRVRAASASMAIPTSESLASDNISQKSHKGWSTPYRQNVWNSQIDWSRSNVEISSDEESLPSSSSSAEISELGLQGLDDSNADTEVQFQRLSRWDIVSLHPHVSPPFRSRANTVDGPIIPLRRSHIHQQRRDDEVMETPDRHLQHSTGSDFFRSQSNNRNKRHRFTPGSGIIFLFFVATYTTFWLPYPEFQVVEQQRVEEMLLKSSISSLSDPPVFIDGPASFTFNDEAALDERKKILSSPRSFGTHGVRGGSAAFARRSNQLKQFRPEEMRKFYQQKAFQQQHQSTWLPWHANVGILVSVALWAVAESVRKRLSAQRIES